MERTTNPSKNINVHNTNRIFNCNLTTQEEVNDFIKVTSLNEDEIYKEMKELESQSKMYSIKNDKKYMLYKQRYSDDTLYLQVINHAGFVYYYTDDKVPLPIVNELSKYPNSEVIFRSRKHFSFEEVQNIQLTSMSTKVSIDVPVVLPDMNIYDYLFSLHPLRYDVDNVNISFPPLNDKEVKKRHKEYYFKKDGMYYLKTKYKYKVFSYLNEPLSTWKMNIWLVCDSEQDLESMERKITKNHKRFQNKKDRGKGGEKNE